MREVSTVMALLAGGLGAATGACLRWALSECLNSRFPVIPAGTLAANLIGAFLIGCALALFAARPMPPEVKLFCVTRASEQAHARWRRPHANSLSR